MRLGSGTDSHLAGWIRPVAGFALAAAAAALASGALQAAPTAAAEDEGPSCKDCHEEVFEAAAKSIHAKVVAEPALDSCEMCHSGLAGHLKFVQADPRPKKPPLAGFAKPADCLLCHSTIPARHEKSMPAWKESRGKACTTCHDPHADGEAVKKLHATGPFADAAAAATGGAKPAGMAACSKCHDAPVRDFKASAHAKALADRGEAACESCHGAASLHIASGGFGRLVVGPRKMDAEGQARFCLACHEKNAPDHAREFAGSRHAEGGKNCLSCHHIHSPATASPEGGFARLADAEKGATRVGSARCTECHKDPHPGLAKSRHAPVMAAADGRGCEGCHGPGSAHAAAGGKKALILDPKRLEPADRDAICLSCHQRTSSPAAWSRQAHGAAGIACLTCHDPFGLSGSAPAREPQPALCAKCHGAQVALFKLPNHHPVEEGSLRCSDCHDLHRAAPAVFAGKKWTDTCAKCHRTEASPRLHPHEAGRADGCIACHEPHGTSSPRLLRFGRVVDLCLSCHIPPATHDLSPGAGFANCIACHTEIHGSDADKKLLR